MGRASIRRAQPRTQQVFPTEDVQWQVAVAFVIAVEEPSLLLPMQRIVRGVYIQDHLLRRLRMRFHKHLQQQLVHPRRVGHDLLVRALRSLQRGPLQSVQGALACQRFASIRLHAPELPRQVVPVAQ